MYFSCKWNVSKILALVVVILESGGTAFFCLVQTIRQRMRKCFCSPIASLPNRKINMLVFCCFFFKPAIDISVDFMGINVR